MVVDVGSLVKKARHEKGMSQSFLAAESGIAQSTLSYIENGSKQPKYETLCAICRGLGIGIFDLLEHDKSRSSSIKESFSAMSLFEQNSHSAKNTDPALK